MTTKETAKSWKDICKNNLPRYETRLVGMLCRFYQHPNGRWVFRLSHKVGATSMNFESKKECWNEANRLALKLAIQQRKK